MNLHPDEMDALEKARDILLVEGNDWQKLATSELLILGGDEVMAAALVFCYLPALLDIARDSQEEWKK